MVHATIVVLDVIFPKHSPPFCTLEGAWQVPRASDDGIRNVQTFNDFFACRTTSAVGFTSCVVSKLPSFQVCPTRCVRFSVVSSFFAASLMEMGVLNVVEFRCVSFFSDAIHVGLVPLFIFTSALPKICGGFSTLQVDGMA